MSRPKSRLSSFAAWFDAAKTPTGPEQSGVDWLRILPFIGMHLACFAVIGVGWSPFAVFFALGAYLLRMFAVTAFYHRYFSHRTFKTSRFAQFLFAVAGNTCVQRGPLWWAAHHRRHHRYSDQPEDPHSPLQKGFFTSHVGWILDRKNFRTQIEEVPDLAEYRELRFLDRFDTLVPLLFAAAVFGLGALLERFAPGLGTNGPQLLVWGFFISTVVLYHGTFTINSLAHVFGYQTYKTGDTSRNNWLLALITLGEGWHNNHHFYPGSVRQGFRWWQIDVSWYGLSLLAALGIVWDLRKIPERVLKPAG
jgi:stearoyl-CoA desaturase (delta-9 desaturase)